MALLAFQTILAAGITPTFTAVNTNDTINPSAAASVILLRVKNTSGSPVNVTVVDSGKTPAGTTGTAAAVSIPATTGDVTIYVDADKADPATGLVTVNYASTASMTAALLTA